MSRDYKSESQIVREDADEDFYRELHERACREHEAAMAAWMRFRAMPSMDAEHPVDIQQERYGHREDFNQ